jgi:hypothetical protein
MLTRRRLAVALLMRGRWSESGGVPTRDPVADVRGVRRSGKQLSGSSSSTGPSSQWRRHQGVEEGRPAWLPWGREHAPSIQHPGGGAPLA